jgi:hypothetical protein
VTIAADIFVVDTTLSPQPIVGVVVNLYDPANQYAFVATATTDSTGKAAFLVPGSGAPGYSYEVRFFKLGVIFTSPFSIQVIDPLTGSETNQFNAAGTLLTLETATDPRNCRCTGRFMDQSNQPIEGLQLYVGADMPFQNPKVVDGNMIASSDTCYTTDCSGYVKIDLLRTGVFWVRFAGDESETWRITVPNQSSVNLNDLIHPQPAVLTYNSEDAPSNTLNLTVGQTADVAMSLLFTNFQTLTSQITEYLQFTPSETGIVDFSAFGTNGSLSFLALAAGTVTITASPVPCLFPNRVPGYSVTAPVLTVVVS